MLKILDNRPYPWKICIHVEILSTFCKLTNLVPRVLRLFGQRVGARRDSGWLPHDSLHCLTADSCGNKIPVPQSLLATNCWPKSLRTLGMRLQANMTRMNF